MKQSEQGNNCKARACIQLNDWIEWRKWKRLDSTFQKIYLGSLFFYILVLPFAWHFSPMFLISLERNAIRQVLFYCCSLFLNRPKLLHFLIEILLRFLLFSHIHSVHYPIQLLSLKPHFPVYFISCCSIFPIQTTSSFHT